MSQRPDLSDEAVARLKALREELSAVDPGPRSDGSRHASSSAVDLSRIRRRWSEATFSLFPTSRNMTGSAEAQNNCLVFLASGGRCRALSKGQAFELPLSQAELRKRLRWIYFECRGPMLDPCAKPETAMAQLRILASHLLGPVADRDGNLVICPDGTFWNVPWTACADALGLEVDVEITLHPAFSGGDGSVSGAAPMLWVARHGDLPRVEDEAQHFLTKYPEAIVCRSADEARAALSKTDVSILHVISHSRFNAGHPMFSSIDFADGPILAAEIARSGLRAELVTMSGCDTGRLENTNRQEPDGLVRAFLSRGVRYVVGSAWPLDDEAAMHFYDEFYGYVKSGANIGTSLRQARRYVKSWKGHPYYWAFPLLYSGYRSC